LEFDSQYEKEALHLGSQQDLHWVGMMKARSCLGPLFHVSITLQGGSLLIMGQTEAVRDWDVREGMRRRQRQRKPERHLTVIIIISEAGSVNLKVM